MERRHWLIEFFRWDIRAILAASLGLVALVALALAATETSLVTSFDFGGASLSDKAAGMVQVKGSLSPYPQTSGALTFGWAGGTISELSDKSVSDLMRRDYNTGGANATFRISGLGQGAYSFKATVGSPSTALSTRMTIGGVASAATASAGTWQIINLMTTTDTGTVDIGFASANGQNPWGVNGLAIYNVVGDVATPSFTATLTPSQQTISAGNTAAFVLGVTPLNNYSGGVSAAISGLTSGVTAEFVPSQLTSVPGTIALNLYTKTTLPPTSYTFSIVVTGNDANVTQRTVPINLTVTTASTVPDPSGDINPPDGSDVVPVVPLRTPREVQEDFSRIDEFVAAERAKVVQKSNLNELKAISDSLSSIPVYEGLPEPKTITESILQKFVQAGIIGTATDVAPPVQQPPEKPGFWKGLWQSIFKSAS